MRTDVDIGSFMTVGAASLNLTPGDWSGNTARIRSATATARDMGAQVLVLPEMTLTGYEFGERFLSNAAHDRAMKCLEELLPDTAGMLVTVGLPVRVGVALYNCVAVLINGRIAGIVAKQDLPNSDIHYEKRWFREWPRGSRTEISIPGIDYKVPFGDLVFDVNGIKIALEICEEGWTNARTGSFRSRWGIDLFLNPSMSHFALRKHAHRERFVVDGSRAFGCTYVYANGLGNMAGRIVYDGGGMIASGGKLVARGPRLSYKDVEVTCVQVDIGATRTSRTRSVSTHVETGNDPTCVHVDCEFRTEEPASSVAIEAAAWEFSDDLEMEELTRAACLGAFDYMRKSGTKGFLVSLSGGADSTATAVLVAKMVELGIADLGLEGFKERLGHIKAIQNLTGGKEIVGALLRCIYTATRNSSNDTLRSAREVAAELGAKFHNARIDRVINCIITIVSRWIGRVLPWKSDEWGDDDITLQNIQARVRGVIAWTMANIYGVLLLTTSNRSEAAVGYCTMDGDTCGGLNLIGGIAKSTIWRWLKWMESDAGEDIIPVVSLKYVNALKATAELRPKDKGQTDEDDIGPYDVRDALETYAIQDWKAPIECFQLLKRDFDGKYTNEQLEGWIVQFLKLWSYNQWKRERYAPCLHLDDRNLDPRTWCRFPILSAGYRDEIKDLADYVAALKG